MLQRALFMRIARVWLPGVLLLAACAPAEHEPTSTSVTCAGKCDGTGRDAPDYHTLGETGFFGDDGRIAPTLVQFVPAFPAWNDGVAKTRWIELPRADGAVVDTSNMDQWSFPVGTKVWEQFTETGGSTAYETRFIERIDDTGEYARDFFVGSFVWDETQNGRTARLARDGATDVLGSGHDVPSAASCADCHSADPSVVLGFSAIQLAGQSFMRDPNVLSAPLADGAFADVPGDAITRAALGYLHGNCGHCHNASDAAQTGLHLRVGVGLSVEQTGAMRTAVGGDPARIVRGDPDHSVLFQRMSARDEGAMPPLDIETNDEAGIAAVRAWIVSLAMPATTTEPTAPAVGECGEVTVFGHCNGATVEWCSEGKVVSVDCSQYDQTCGYVNDVTGFYCVNGPG